MRHARTWWALSQKRELERITLTSSARNRDWAAKISGLLAGSSATRVCGSAGISV